MSKQNFITEIENLLTSTNTELSAEAAKYFEAMKLEKVKPVKKFTENGKMILSFMKDNKDNYNNIFSAKGIGEGLNISSRTVSGAIRKLVTDGYVEKIDGTPIAYSVTEKGLETNPEEELVDNE